MDNNALGGLAALRVICVAMVCFWVPAACGGRSSGFTPAQSHVPVEVLYGGSQCRSIRCAPAGRAPAAAWVVLPKLLGILPGKGPEALSWDTDREGVLCIFMGERPTAGYSLELAQAQARVDHRIATVTVYWREPRPGAAAAQVVTSPCLIVKMPRIGLDQVQVADQQGIIRHVVTVE